MPRVKGNWPGFSESGKAFNGAGRCASGEERTQREEGHHGAKENSPRKAGMIGAVLISPGEEIKREHAEDSADGLIPNDTCRPDDFGHDVGGELARVLDLHGFGDFYGFSEFHQSARTGLLRQRYPPAADLFRDRLSRQ